jgi:hypothetical protein
MMTALTTKQIYVTPQPQPTMPVQFVKPVSYEFRVAEHMNADGTIAKIGLQVQVHEHDEYGVGIVTQYWKDVERVQVPYVALVG